MEYFIDPPNEERREEAFERVQKGEDNLPGKIPLEDALHAVIKGEMRDPALKPIVENYHESVAARVLYLQTLQTAIDEFKNTSVNDVDTFERYVNLAGDVLQEAYLTESPGRGYSKFLDQCITDTEHHLQLLRNIRNRFEKTMDEVDVDDTGRLDGFTALPRILDQYARYYELVRDPLRDLAICLEGAEVAELSDTAKVLDLLKRTEHSDLSNIVEPDLRNAAFHLCYEIDEDEGIIRVLSGRDRNRFVEAEYSFNEVLEKYHFVQDAIPGIIFSYVIVSEVLTIQYLESPDFMFKVISESDPEFFD